MALNSNWNFRCSIPEAIAGFPALAAGNSDPLGGSLGKTGSDKLPAIQTLRTIIIEDELFVAWLVEDLLETLGHEVVGIFSSGEEALAADIQHAELAVVDINLGRGMDGIQVATELRRRYSMPLLFCSAYTDDATLKRISQTLPGANLISKPVLRRDLEAAINSALMAKH